METSQLDPDEHVYIHNAGLVIIAPFLNQYFSMLGMLEGDSFVSEDAADRAVLLLQYVADGQTETAEHLLVFNKIICGLPMSRQLPTAINLTEQEIDASEQLLNAVLQNWDKMSSSSVESLREAFLLRESLLSEQEEHWNLKIENKGIDILLSLMPWSISVIKLPWMAKRIETNWGTGV